ncbi:MAG: hypothetical protein CMK07_09710 [Ponticaulis sp.]|nr:hypothetical protein [Ponticaulis sp.]
MLPVNTVSRFLKASIGALVAAFSVGMAHADDFITGYHAYLNNEPRKAISIWTRTSADGDLLSQLALGKLMMQGQAFEQAEVSMKKAAEQGALPAKAWLAYRDYYSGSATDAEKSAALQTLKEADVLGFRTYNTFVFRGTDIPRLEPRNRYEKAVAEFPNGDLDWVVEAFEAEVAAGNLDAKSELACISIYKPFGDNPEPPRPMSKADATSYLLEQALKGDWIAGECVSGAFPDNPSATYILDGISEFLGQNTVTFVLDRSYAEDFYGGTLDTSLAKIRSVLMGVDSVSITAGEAALQAQDYATAFKIYSLLADQNNFKAQYYLAQLYARGLGTTRSAPDVAKWLKSAADGGYVDAQYEYGAYILQGQPDFPTDKSVGVTYLETASGNGSAAASFELGKAYVSGQGVDQDLSMANFYAVQAKTDGHPQADQLLQLIARAIAARP